MNTRSYDDYLAYNPKDEETDFECPMCGDEIEEDQDYCSKDCYKASWI